MSCTDVQTIQAGNGTKTQFSFDFPYIFKSEIHVYFWNATTKEWDEKLTTDATHPWRITDANPTIVEFTSTAPPSPATPVDPGEPTVDNVRIRRITNIDDIRALFNPGSAIRSDDLNNNFEQLRYAIQEANCQDVPEEIEEYINTYYWNNYADTVKSSDTWDSSDTKIATTAALDARFQDEANETITSSESWVSDNDHIATTAAIDARFQDELSETITSSETWPDNDDTIATTAAIDNRIDTAITNDIGTDGTGITVTDDGDGTITLGLANIDLDRIKASDIITYAEQNAGPTTDDDSIFTSSAAARRFDTLVQTATPSGTDWEVGKTWLQNDADKTLSIWDGDSWEGISSGGTFTSQSRVIYVDPVNGNDDNDGHRISRPKATIKDAIADINADSTFGDGSVVVVAPGVYQEVAPIQIQRRDVSIVGTSLRSCIVHPTQATETNNLFEVNSGTYLSNLTFTGVKASGTRGESGSLYEDSTYGLPATQGWNVAFFAGATIVKSPYIQNCTNFSDSEIDNTDLDFFAGTEDKGRAGDEDSAMTGGGILVDGSVPAATSPLRSMVCDSYTHVGLNGPGILVTNNGYVQATSSYAFFNHFHIACINGGQANLAASTSDFGQYSLIADGKSPNPVLTSTVDGAASDGATSFNIDAATGSTDLYNEAGTENDNAWFGSSTRPAPNMLVEVNSVIYPITSVTANGTGWTINISRPDTSNRSNNLGLNGAISDAATVNFYLRSMIASSGHTMEYVGSGTDYSALPENGGVPNEARQITELNDGKIWTVITDHNGKLRIGGNQTDDPIFEVDQQTGFITIPEGSISFNLLSDETPQLGGNLDVQARTITTSTTDGNVVLDPNGTGTVDVSTSRITSVTDPTGAQDAATKNYVDTNALLLSGGTMTGDITFNAGQTIDGYVPQTSTTGSAEVPAGTEAQRDGTPSAGYLRFNTDTDSFEGYDGTSWGNIGGGASAGGAIYENSQSITADYTLTANTNGMSAGPITIDSGVTVTIPSGSTWVIV